MKDAPYISSSELPEFLTLGALATGTEEVANNTTVKEWRQWLRTIVTLSRKVINGRVAALDPKQRETILRRVKHSTLKVVSSDKKRVTEESKEEVVTVSWEDMYEALDGCMLQCCTCKQGDMVKSCKRREMFHRLGVEPLRFEPKDGECEFRLDNERYAVTTDYRRDDTMTIFGVGE